MNCVYLIFCIFVILFGYGIEKASQKKFGRIYAIIGSAGKLVFS